MHCVKIPQKNNFWPYFYGMLFKTSDTTISVVDKVTSCGKV